MELMRGDIARVERLINAFEFKPIKALPSNAQILTQSKNTFGLMQVFKVQQNYGFHLEYLGMELIAFRDFSVELADNGGLNVWIFLDFWCYF